MIIDMFKKEAIALITMIFIQLIIIEEQINHNRERLYQSSLEIHLVREVNRNLMEKNYHR